MAGTPDSAICNSSSVDTLPLACIWPRAVATLSICSEPPPAAATASPTAAMAGSTLSAAMPNPSSFWVAPTSWGNSNGVVAAVL
jgi:hypothetical protein